MIIAIGADHRGFALKKYVMGNVPALKKFPIIWHDVGCYDDFERYDYPDYAIAASKLVQQEQVSLGLLICGSGVGMAIAANRFDRIYAAVAWDPEVAAQSRAHASSCKYAGPS